MEKTGITPEKFQQGYIYKFNDFETIDKTLDILNKVLQTKTPLDYIISVHVYQKSFSDQFDTLLKLISLELINKISKNYNPAPSFSQFLSLFLRLWRKIAFFLAFSRFLR